jgi:hypothetical protein
MSLLNTADIYVVVFQPVLEFEFFASHSFGIPLADLEVVAGSSTLPCTSYMLRVRGASR